MEETSIDEIVVNGETYVKKSNANKMAQGYLIVRSDRAGVFAGTEILRQKDHIVLGNCRKLWQWDGAAAVEQLAVDGVSMPENCKFTVPVKSQSIKNWIQIIPATEKAQKSIREVPEWRK